MLDLGGDLSLLVDVLDREKDPFLLVLLDGDEDLYLLLVIREDGDLDLSVVLERDEDRYVLGVIGVDGIEPAPARSISTVSSVRLGSSLRV